MSILLPYLEGTCRKRLERTLLCLTWGVILMNMIDFYKSIGHELNALKNRVRNLMQNPHWLSDGELKEAILRMVLKRHLPENIKVARGFIFSPENTSSQIDILLYDSSYPVMFREGDFVFVTPDAVRGIIEVKTQATITIIEEALQKLASNASIVYGHRHNQNDIQEKEIFVGLFAYEIGQIRNPGRILESLEQVANGDRTRVVNHICLGVNYFYKFWYESSSGDCMQWRSYQLEDLAPAYFISNILDWVSPSVSANEEAWFPLDSKERRKIGEMFLLRRDI